MTSDNTSCPPSTFGDDFANLWRDGRLLVMHQEHTRFPNRCLKTNETVDGRRTPLKLVFEPHPGQDRQEVTLKVPLNDRCRKKAKRKNGAMILLIGLLMFFGGGIVSAMQQDWALIVLFLGILLLPIGAVVMYVQSRGPIQVVAIDGQWIWLKGVNAEFLATLPVLDSNSQLSLSVGPTTTEQCADTGNERPAAVTRSATPWIVSVFAFGLIVAGAIFKGVRLAHQGDGVRDFAPLILLGALGLAGVFFVFVIARVVQSFRD